MINEDDKGLLTTMNQPLDFNRPHLLLVMTQTLSMRELRTVCFELGINHDDLQPGGLTDQARELIILCDHNARIDELIALLTKKRPNADWESVYRLRQIDESPFKGLAYFDVNDANLFFGRETLIAELVRELRGNSFLAVVGESGSGKSSLVRAGLVPTLQGISTPKKHAQLPEGSTTWPIHIITPTAKPLEALSISLTQDAESTRPTEILINDLAQNPRSLHLHIKKSLARNHYGIKSENPTSRLLLIIDQFEELFTLCHSEEERWAFIANLMTATHAKLNGPTIVVVVLRADFYGHCSQYDALRLALEKKQKLIGQMSIEELRRAIEAPAKIKGVTFEKKLVELMLKNVGAGGKRRSEPAALPLLSHALLETWKRRKGNQLTIAGYFEAGGVSGAIAQTADRTYLSLPYEQQRIARNIFLRLTELGEGTLETRRRAKLDELMLRKSEEREVAQVLKILVDARLVITGRNEAEVAHESLIREWPKLQEWLDQDREGHRLHGKLTRDALEWQTNKQDSSFLYRGTRMAAVEEWLGGREDALNETEAIFIARSRAKEQELLVNLQTQAEAERARADQEAKTNRKLKVISAILLSLFLFAAIAFSVAFNRQQVVDAQRLAFASQSQVDTSPETALLLALEAAMRVPDFQSNQAIRDALEAFSWRPTQLIGHTDRVNTAEISPDGQYALTSSTDGMARLWSTDGRSNIVLKGHEGKIFSAKFSTDGSRVLTASADETARLWNLKGESLVTYAGHTGEVLTAVFSPDGQFVLTASKDKTAKLWKLNEATAIVTYEGHEKKLKNAVFSPNGEQILTVTKNEARRWELNGTLIQTYENDKGKLKNAVFSPDGTQILTSATDGEDGIGYARLWTLDGETLADFSQTAYIKNAIFSPDGLFVLTIGGDDNVVQMWNLMDQSTIKFYGHTNTIEHIIYSPNGQYILTASQDGTARLWDTQGQSLATIRGHASIVPYASFSRDGGQIITASWDGTARIWQDIGTFLPVFTEHVKNIESVEFSSAEKSLLLTASDDGTALLWNINGKRFHYVGHTDEISSAVFNPDESRILTASDDNTARLWSLDGQQFVSFEHEGEVKSASFSPNGQLILTGSKDSTAKLWGFNGSLHATFEGHTDQITSSLFVSDNQILTTSDDGTAKLWNSEGQEIMSYEEHASGVPIRFAILSPDKQIVLTCSEELTCRLWNMEGKTLAILEGHTVQIEGAGFSPDGQRIVTASGDRTARLWDIEGNLLEILEGHTNAVEMAEFSPDGKVILTISRDRTARLWNLAGEEIAILRGHDHWLGAAAFSADGKFIATGSRDKTVRLHYVYLDDLISVAKCRIGRGLTEQEIAQFSVGQPKFLFEKRDCLSE